MSKRIRPILVLCLFLSVSVQAEVLILKDGKIVNGKVSNQTGHTVTVVESSGVRTFEKRFIFKIIYATDPAEIEKLKRAELAKLMETEEYKELMRKQSSTAANRKDEELSFVKLADDKVKPKFTAGDLIAEERRQYRKGAIFRSAFIPGWGQWYKERNKAGLVFLGLSGAAAGAYFLGNQNFSTSSSNYNSQNINYLVAVQPMHSIPLGLWQYSQASSSRSSMNSSSSMMLSASSALILIYFANLIHSWYVDPKFLQEEQEQDSMLTSASFKFDVKTSSLQDFPFLRNRETVYSVGFAISY